MRIPNHTLFHEKIVNCAESTGVAYELQIHFSYYGPSKSTQVKATVLMCIRFAFDSHLVLL